MVLNKKELLETIKEIENDLEDLSDKFENKDTKEKIDAIVWRLQKVWESVLPIETDNS